jgi:hypothetical protein
VTASLISLHTPPRLVRRRWTVVCRRSCTGASISCDNGSLRANASYGNHSERLSITRVHFVSSTASAQFYPVALSLKGNHFRANL